MLLGREGVNPDKPDYEGRTSLSHAAEGGHGGVVEVLLKQEGVDPDKLDNDGRTPLSYVGCDANLLENGGHTGIAGVLLGREDVKPHQPANNGRTPLSHAASRGRERLVEILLRREEVNPDKPDVDEHRSRMRLGVVLISIRRVLGVC